MDGQMSAIRRATMTEEPAVSPTRPLLTSSTRRYETRGAAARSEAAAIEIGHSVQVRGPSVEVLGVHPVTGVESCFLVEVIVEGAPTAPDLALFTQALPDAPQSNWQVPYGEKLLDADGHRVARTCGPPTLTRWPKRARLVFFFHDLEVDRPLRTPFGDVLLPRPTPKPKRLDVVSYEAP
jgi:hypothetical protein